MACSESRAQLKGAGRKGVGESARCPCLSCSRCHGNRWWFGRREEGEGFVRGGRRIWRPAGILQGQGGALAQPPFTGQVLDRNPSLSFLSLECQPRPGSQWPPGPPCSPLPLSLPWLLDQGCKSERDQCPHLDAPRAWGWGEDPAGAQEPQPCTATGCRGDRHGAPSQDDRVPASPALRPLRLASLPLPVERGEGRGPGFPG